MIFLIAIFMTIGLGTTMYRTAPPMLLSYLDYAMGGGIGAERAASAEPFGDKDQKLNVWRPSEPSGDKRPVLIFWYGGGWANGARDEYAFAARAFAKAGFVVVMPDYRKVPDIHFPAMLQDGAQAVKWTRDNIAHYGGDPDQISFSGHSAGAYIAIMLALDDRWFKAEGVDPKIVKAAVGLSGPYDFYPFDKKRSIDAFSRAPEPLLTQPIHFARADAPPMLLITSSKDTTVRPYNAVNLTAALKKLGAVVEMQEYQGLDHEEVAMALSKPFRGKAPVLADSVRFMKRHVGSAPQESISIPPQQE